MAAARFSAVVELRRYTLHAGRRDDLISLLEAHLVEPQEDAGMAVIGQFRDLDRPDMFVWLRGFESMEARRAALSAFYGGPVWDRHKDAANATMIDSDDVLLLRPAWPDAGFDLSANNRSGQSSGLVVATVHHLARDAEPAFAASFAQAADPILAKSGASPIAAFISEHHENTFPRLPVRADENVFVTFSTFDSEATFAAHEATLAASPEWQAFRHHLAKPSETLRLSPTRQSRLGRR